MWVRLPLPAHSQRYKKNMNTPVPEHVTNHSRITDHIIVGSDLCKGESCPVHSPVFRQMHIAAEIDLEIEHDEPVTPRLDMYVRLPTANQQAPSQAQLRIAVLVIHEMVGQNKNIYIHCQNGHGRAPTVVAAYFIKYEHLTVADAIAKVKSKRPEIHLEAMQIKALEKFLEESHKS